MYRDDYRDGYGDPRDKYPRRPRGMDHGGYGGGYGGGGYGLCGDCGECQPYLMPGVGCALIFLSWVMFLPGYAAPYWMSNDTNDSTTETSTYIGLWQSCTKTETIATRDKDTTCFSTTDTDKVDFDWYKACQALTTMCLISLIFATCLLVYWLCSYSRYFCIKVIYLCLLLLAFLFLLIAVILFGANADDDFANLDFDWSFYLVDVACSLLLFAGIVLMCVPSYESYPQGIFGGFGGHPDGFRDRFGFDYDRRGPPPPPMRGPPPMGRLEPIATLPAYPSSLPRGYGGGGGGDYGRGGYPSMPYGSRY